ncbi:hypothetical protein [Cuniculiplasma sp. SKW4]|uniref:hypothetical protein n=1 Tax=Cuniculiplasma sp. SKW4 TaxID=3400171 RepID=UPI003FD3C843
MMVLDDLKDQIPFMERSKEYPEYHCPHIITNQGRGMLTGLIHRSNRGTGISPLKGRHMVTGEYGKY